MAKVQKWYFEDGEDKFNIEISCRGIVKKLNVKINDDVFVLPKKPARREMLKLGDTQAMLDIGKKGRATIYIGAKVLEEN
jgi:hypothetical protein